MDPALLSKARRTLAALERRYPHPATLLSASSPWELLVATILAAQCTDARVNMVTPALFARWPDPESLAQADTAAVEECIRSTGFFRNKAKNLVAAAARIRNVFGGQVPRSLAELISLPGVARKTASVVLFGAYGINEGFAVDTHVRRIAFRLGLSSTQDPWRTEQELMALFPQKEWGNLNHRMVWFGRDVCRARKPDCSSCEMENFCAKTGFGR
jgi:endonuclease-3